MHTYVYCSTIYNSKDLESTQMLINDRLDKENVSHTHHGIPRSLKTIQLHGNETSSYKKDAAIKKDEVISFAETGMNLEAIILSKVTQEQKTKQHMFSLISGS